MALSHDPFRVRSIDHTMDGYQAISFLVSNRCQAPWFLYFETILPFAGDAILRLLEFGATDVIRDYFRPGGTRGGRHFRRGKRKPRRPRGIPEISDAIAKRLPGRGDLAGRRVTDGVRNLWFVDGVIQNQLLNLLIADIIDDTLIGWAQMLRSEACGKGKGPAYILEKDRLVAGGLNDWIGVAFMTEVSPNPGLIRTPVYTPGPRGAIIACSATGRRVFGGPPEIAIGLNGGPNPYAVSTTYQTAGNSEYGVVAAAYVPAGKTVGFDVYANPGFAEFTDLRFVVNPL